MEQTNVKTPPDKQSPGDQSGEATNFDRVVRLNLKFIIVSVLIFATVGVGMHFLHLHMVDRNADGLLARATSARDAGKHKEAIRFYRQYVKFRPNDIEALTELGILLDDTAETNEQLVGVYGIFEQILRMEPEERSDIRRRVVDVAMKIGRYRDAVMHLQVLWPLTPDDPELPALAARCSLYQAREIEAVVLYMVAIGLNPENANYYKELSQVLAGRMIKLPNRQELIRMVNDAKQSPVPAEVVENNEQLLPDKVLALLPDGAEAVPADPKKVARQILELMVSEGKPAYFAYLVRSSYREQNGELELAQEDVDRALQMAGDRADVLLPAARLAIVQANSAQQEGEYAKVVEFLESARQFAEYGLELDQPDLKFYLVLSQVELKLDHLADAEQHLRTGLAQLDQRRQKPQADKDTASHNAADKNVSADNANGKPAVGKAKDSFEAQSALRAEMLFSLADILIMQVGMVDDSDELKAKLAEAHKLNQQLRENRRYRGYGIFLDAIVLVAEEKWHAARVQLEESRSELADASELVRRIDLLLGRCYDKLGNPDARVDIFRRALKDDPLWIAGRLQLASALAGVNQLDDALGEYQTLGGIPGVALTMARLLTVKQLSKPADERRWDAVERLLAAEDELRSRRGESPSLDVAILRAETLHQQQQFSEAQQTLEDAKQEHLDAVEAWTSLANLEMRRNDRSAIERFESARRVLDEAGQKFGDIAQLRMAAVSLARMQQPAEVEVMLTELEQNIEKFKPDEQARLLQLLGQAYARIGADDQALERWRAMAALQPNDMGITVFVGQLAVTRQDSKLFQQQLANVRRLEGSNGPNGNYLEASYLIQLASREEALRSDGKKLDSALQKPRALLQLTARQRPYWPRVFQMLGNLEALVGNADAAVDHYQKALTLGDRSRAVIEYIANYFYERKQFDEADRIIRQYGAEDPALLTDEMARLAWRVAWQRQQFEQALGLAARLATRSKDFRDKVWNAQLLFARYQGLTPEERLQDSAKALISEADALFLDAIEMAADEPSVWLSYVVHLSRLGRIDEAARVIEDARAKLPATPPALAPYNLARCYEIVGMNEEAEKEYQAAVAADPKDFSLQMAVVDYYTRQGRFEEVGTHLDAILDPKSSAPEFALEWSKRRKALLIGVRGDYQQSLQAIELLASTGKSIENRTIADLRAEAIILGRRTGRRDQAAVIKALEEIGRRNQLTIDERFVLARTQEKFGNWERAQESYQDLLAADPSNLVALTDFVFATLDRPNPTDDELKEAESLVVRLEEMQPNSFGSVTARARLLGLQKKGEEAIPLLEGYLARLQALPPEQALRDLVEQQKPQEALQALSDYFRRAKDGSGQRIVNHAQRLLGEGQSDEALAILQRYIGGSDFIYATQTGLVRAVAGLMEEIGQYAPAEKTLKEYIARVQEPKAQLLLAGFFARRGRTAEALSICEAAWADCRPVDVASVSVGILRLTPDPTDAQIQQVESWLLAAMQREMPPVRTAIAISFADLKDFRQDYSEAIAGYRVVLHEDPQSLVALNNLAFLLSFQPGKGTESLQLINKAIEIAGPASGLLDTRGSILSRLGKSSEALQDLTRSADDFFAAEILFHLAEVQWKLGDKKAAGETFMLAKNAGLTEKQLHPLERPAYRKLVQQIKNSLPADTAQAQR